MTIGGPELVFIAMVIAAVFAFWAAREAFRAGQPWWTVAILVGALAGVGWLVAIAYLRLGRRP